MYGNLGLSFRETLPLRKKSAFVANKAKNFQKTPWKKLEYIKYCTLKQYFLNKGLSSKNPGTETVFEKNQKKDT